MALDFPNSPTIGDEFAGGGFTWVWDGSAWTKLAPATASASSDFVLSVGTSGDTTYVLGGVYPAGRYTIDFVNDDTSYDIYFIAENGTLAGYTNSAVAQVSADFTEVVVIGAANNETILFNYDGALTAPSSSGDVATAGAFLTATSESSLPDIDDFTVLTGGNFASDVAVAFIGQDAVAVNAKLVVRSSSTELLATRPNAFPIDQSPYSVRVLNPGIPAPSGTNAHILSNAINAGTSPVWVTESPLTYNVTGSTPTITLLATDTEGSDIDYSVVTGTIPVGLTLDGETGEITGSFTGTASEGDTNSVTFRATDAGGNFVDKALNFVANAAPTWTTAAGALPDATPSSYSFQLVASGETVGGSLTFSLQSGSILPGLTLSSSGLLSGTTTAAEGESSEFTVRVTDPFGLFADRTFTIQRAFLAVVTGGTLTSDSTYFYRTFTSNGTLSISNSPLNADVLMIAGGGGGGSRDSFGAAGGGAGGFFPQLSQSLSVGSKTIVIGAGGSGGPANADSSGSNGFNTTFTELSPAIGGGAGGRSTASGSSGGSGGGGGTTAFGGAGTAGQGNSGGSGIPSGDVFFMAGGGGGAGGSGLSGNINTAGNGGVGSNAYASWATVTGTGRDGGYYAGGGAAAGQSGPTPVGGLGGGGSANAGAGFANTGGGGAANKNSNTTGGAGGSGLVIVRYLRTAVAA
jgi:hypothetical protein